MAMAMAASCGPPGGQARPCGGPVGPCGGQAYRLAGCRQARAVKAAVAACWVCLEAGQGRAGGLPRQAGR